jgi:NADH dehydrogenase
MPSGSKQPLISVIGGTGFLGRAVVNLLLRENYDVQIISRRASDAKSLFPLTASGGRLLLTNADITQPKTLHDCFDNSFAVINLVGILFERGKQRFETLHSQCPERLAKLAKDSGVERFIQISALGVHQAKGSDYAESKAMGEQAVLSEFPKATILSPSVIFGPEDNFINQFDQMASLSPALPLIGGGLTKFQPVYVEDVAKAVLACLKDADTAGQSYELGGPEVFTFKEILRLILKITKRERLLVPLSWTLAKITGFFGEFAPTPPLTRDQVELLKHDNIVSKDGFKELGITPAALEPVIRSYLRPGKPAPHFLHKDEQKAA